MQKFFPRIATLGSAILLAGTGQLLAGAEYKQPRMELAVQDLEGALKADDPASLLRQAKGELQRVQGDKGGFRERSIQIIDTALADAQAGNRTKANEDITSAIAAVHSGMSRAYR